MIQMVMKKVNKYDEITSLCPYMESLSCYKDPVIIKPLREKNIFTLHFLVIDLNKEN